MPIFRVNSVKNYNGQKKFTRAPLVVLVTNMRYEVTKMFFKMKMSNERREEEKNRGGELKFNFQMN